MANWKFYLDNNEVEEPIGWDAIEFTAIRMESHGIDQPFSTEVKFWDKGARYIKSIYDQHFINQPIAIKISSDVGYNNSPYEFNGYLNLAIYQERNVCDTDSWEITVGILEDEFKEDFKSRMDVEVDILENVDVDGNVIPGADWENIRLHREDLIISAKGGSLAESSMVLKFDADFDISCFCCKWVYPNYLGVFPVYWTSSDFQNPVGSTFDVTGVTYSDSNVIFKNNTSYTRTIKFNVQANGMYIGNFLDPTYTETGDWFAAFRVHDGSGGNNTYYTVYTSQVIPLNLTYYFFNFSSNADVVIPPNYVVSFIGAWGQGGSLTPENSEPPVGLPPLCDGATITIFTDGLCIIATEINQGDYASKCDVLRVENYLKRIIQKITGSSNKLLSETFSKADDGCYWNNAITNGLRIRNAITIEQAETGCGDEPEGLNQSIFKTSWKKSFENLDKIFCLGWAFEWTGTEWKIRVETRDYFYQNLVSQSFANVGEVTQGVLAENLSNHVIIGYNDNWKNQNIGGSWAIMTERNYFISNKALNQNSTSTLDLKTDIIAEGYAIEFSRRLQFYEPGPISSDRPNDYELFIIWMNRYQLSGAMIQDTPLQLLNETGAYTFAPGTVSMPSDFITFSNSIQKGLYNIYHSPARIACRWWKVLGMNTFGLTNPIMRYQAGEYQTTYSSIINGSEEKEQCIEILLGSIAEDANISASILKPEYQDYLFRPIEVTFSYPQSLCDFLTLSQDEQYKKVRLTSGSLVIEGFITQATNQPEDASGGTTQFTLLYSNQQSEPGGAFDAGFDDGYDNGG